MSAHDPYSPRTRVGPHRVFVAPPPDPAGQVPGHPDEILAFMREPGGDLATRAERVDLVEEVEHARPGRMRSIILAAVAWNRAVITGDAPDGDESWADAMRSALASGGSVQDAPPVDEAPPADEATSSDEQPVQDAVAETSDEPPVDEVPDSYSADDVPKNAADVIAWIQAAGAETDAAARSQAAWLVELARSEIRSTVRAEIDKHLD